MKLSINKLNLCQMLCLTLGLLFALFIFMVSGISSKFIAAGITLLTLLFVLLLKSKIAKLIFTVIVVSAALIAMVLSTTRYIKNKKERKGLINQVKNYAICETALPPPCEGIIEEHIIECPSEEACLQEIQSCKVSMDNKCVPKSKKISKIFSNRSISGWYIKVEPESQGGKAQALVYKYGDLFYRIFSPGKIRACVKMRARGLSKFLEEQEAKVNISVISGNGDLVEYSY